MKSILSTLLLTLFVAFASFSQPIPGTHVIGGNAGFSFNKPPSNLSKVQRTTFTISPNIGKFVSEKFLISGGVGYGFVRQVNEQDDFNFSQQNSHSVSLEFGVTRFFPIANKLFFTLGVNMSPSYSVTRTESLANGFEFNGEFSSIKGNLNVSPGLTYFINKKWMLYSYVGALNYEMSYNLENDLIGHSVYANLSANSFGLGARYILGRETKDN